MPQANKQNIARLVMAHKGFVLAFLAGLGVWLLNRQEILDRGEILVIFATTNLTILAGYMFAAVAVGPRFRGVDFTTKVAGFWFFALCGITHLELALHALFTKDGITLDDFTSFHMVVMHAAQAWSIWAFLTGLSRYFREQESAVRNSPMRRATDRPDSRSGV